MYKRKFKQLTLVDDFYLPFGGKLDAENRWVKLANTVPWFAAEESIDLEIAPKTLLVAQSLEVGPEPLPVVTEAVSEEPTSEQSEQSVQPDPRCSEPTPEEPLVNEAAATCSLPIAPPANKGKLILDAIYAPADIHFPTDLGLLNDAREKTEQIIDKLYVHAPEGLKKPRTYRQTARKEFLSVARLRVKSAKKIRNAIRQQLGYVGRNLRSIDALGAVVSLTVLNKKLYVKLLVCAELYRQQLEMYKYRLPRIDDRIVSISQPYVRPIVRGKAGAKTEFGMKLSLSVVDGWSTIEKMSWSAYNEGCDLITETQRDYVREGYYPESVHVDKIYRNRANRQWCKVHGIRISGVPLGRPPKDPEVNAERKRQTPQR